MYTKISVWYGDNPQFDWAYEYRLEEGLDLLKKVLKRSFKPFEINKMTDFDDVGNVAREGYEFIVDEFQKKYCVEIYTLFEDERS